MLTTPGVTVLSIGARLGTVPPVNSGMGAAARPGVANTATPPISTSAERTCFIVVRTLSWNAILVKHRAALEISSRII